MNWMIELMANPFLLYSDYVFEFQQEGKLPTLTYEEWKQKYYDSNEDSED